MIVVAVSILRTQFVKTIITPAQGCTGWATALLQLVFQGHREIFIEQ